MTANFSTTQFDRTGTDRFTRLAKDLGITSFGLNLIVLKPGERGRIHLHHRQEEVYVVIDGELTLLIEGNPQVLGPDSAARVGPNVRRQLSNAGTVPCVLLAMGGEGTHVGKDAEAFLDWDDAEGRPPAEVPPPQDLPQV